MQMNPPTVPKGYVPTPSYDDLVNQLQLIEHATSPTHDDGAYHENAHSLSVDMLDRVKAARAQ